MPRILHLSSKICLHGADAWTLLLTSNASNGGQLTLCHTADENIIVVVQKQDS